MASDLHQGLAFPSPCSCPEIATCLPLLGEGGEGVQLSHSLGMHTVVSFMSALKPSAHHLAGCQPCHAMPCHQPMDHACPACGMEHHEILLSFVCAVQILKKYFHIMTDAIG